MRAEMGLDLARKRRAAGLSQEQLAALIMYSRAAVSHAERGAENVSGGFWESVDRILATGGLFTELHEEIRKSLEPGRRTAAGTGGTGIGCSLALKAEQLDRALAAYRLLGWPVTARGEVLELLPGRWAEVLEVGRAAGEVAAGAWLETGGPGGTACRLPRLSAPDGALAVIDAGARWYFLIRSGFPWPASGHAGNGAEIVWHSASSRVPLPPSRAGQGIVRWAYLPAAELALPSPLPVLDLLDWAIAMTCIPGRLLLPCGAVVAPAGPRETGCS
jgi:transcriptional regulator with XRE-family HTH domain